MSAPSEHDQQVAAAIHHAGWRTGSACSVDATALAWHMERMPAFVRQQVEGKPEGLWVPFVSSQACDLVNGRLSDEPHVELILGCLDVPENAGIAPNKSYRRLQLRHPTKRFVEFRVHDRWLLPRGDLTNLVGSSELDLTWDRGIDLARWIGSRYSRYPLPNALAERMQYNSGARRDWLKKLTAEVEEMRIVVTPPDVELAAGDKYNVVLYVITKNGLSVKATESYDKFKDWLTGLKGLTAQVRLESADTFSYATFKATHRLDLDALTFGYLDGPSGALPAIE